MIDFKELMNRKNVVCSKKKYKEVYDELKPYIIREIIKYLDDKKTSNRGRKRAIDWDKFLECLFGLTDNGLKTTYIKQIFNISKSTYYFYFKMFSEDKLFEKIYSKIIDSYLSINPIDYLITDTFTVKSLDGSQGVGRNPTDRGRKGIKVSLICDQNLVTHSVYIEGANVHDSKILIPTINNSITNLRGYNCLADSGYAGQKYITKVKSETGINVISKPKRTSNKSKMSHTISTSEKLLLDQKRNGIERLNGNIRRFRGIMNKYTKKILSYRMYLFVALLSITCYNIAIL